MAVFTSSDDFYAVMRAVFQRLSADPGATEAFHSSKLVVRIKGTDPTVELVLDGRTNPIQVSFGPQPGRADLELALAVELLHAILTDQASLRKSFMEGRLKVTGNVFRALQLADLFRKIEVVYPQALADHGLES